MAAPVNPITLDDVTVLGSTIGPQVRNQLVTAAFSMSTTAVSELSVDVFDPGFAIWNKGLFKNNMDVNMAGIALSIASVGTKQIGQGAGFTLKARSKGVRLLKARQGALVINNVSASQFVASECKAVGLRAVTQTCQPRLQVARDVPTATTAATAVQPNPNPPSSWTTFGRLAQEQGFICFEADGTVYFGQPTWLIQNSEASAVSADMTSNDYNLRPLSIPTCTSSLDSTTGVSISVDLPQGRARNIRPGYKFQLKGVSQFDSDYIVNSVSFPFSDATAKCTVQAQTPIDPIPTLQMSGTGPMFDPTDPAGYQINLSGLSSVSGSGVTIRGTQLQNAAIIVAVAKRMTSQQRDGAIGCETAMQESSMNNLNYGDRDSLGLFQQRPSQGWGTESQIMNPYYSSYKFYQKEMNVPNRLTRPMSEVAQTVQVSAFPSAYAKWDQLGLNLAAALWPRITIMTKAVKGGLSTVGATRHGTKSAADFVAWAQSRLHDRYIYAYPVTESNVNANIFDCCLTGDTIIYTANRGPMPMRQVKPGDMVRTWDNGVLSSNKVVARARQPVQDVFTVKTRGRSIKGSANHPFLVLRRDARERIGVPVKWRTEWARLDELKRGDWLVALDHAPSPDAPVAMSDGTVITDDMAWLLGEFVGDGRVKIGGVTIAAFRDDVRVRIAKIAKEVWGANASVHPVHGIIVNSSRMRDAFRQSGFDHKAHKKFVPSCIKKLSHDKLRSFLDGYAEADGYVDHRGWQNYSSSSRRLLNEVRALHTELGDRVSNISINNRDRQIVINGKIIVNAQPLYTFEMYPDSPRRHQTILDTYGARRALPDRSFTVERVLNIEHVGKRRTYDLEIEGSHNYIAEGLVVHNSGLVEWAAAQVGIPGLPHQSEDQYGLTKHVTVSQGIATRGALLWTPGHIAISLGNGKTIEAQNEEVGVVNDNAAGRFQGAGLLSTRGMIY